MGVGRRLIQRRHKLRDDVRDDVPKREKVDKRDDVLQDSPGAFGAMRGLRRRQEEDFGQDVFEVKIEKAWESDADIERVDFGGGDFGLRVTFAQSIQSLDRGFIEGDELQIIEEGSALESYRYEGIEEANSGDVAAGRVRVVSDTVLRLPDASPTAAVAAWGFITLDAAFTGGDLIDGETIVLDDGTNPAVTFEFDDGLGGGVTPGNVAVGFVPGDTASDIRDALVTAINGVGAGLAITASPGPGSNPSVALVNDTPGVAGNVAITETVADTGLTVAGMSGGADASLSWADELGVRVRAKLAAGARL